MANHSLGPIPPGLCAASQGQIHPRSRDLTRQVTLPRNAGWVLDNLFLELILSGISRFFLVQHGLITYSNSSETINLPMLHLFDGADELCHRLLGGGSDPGCMSQSSGVKHEVEKDHEIFPMHGHKLWVWRLLPKSPLKWKKIRVFLIFRHPPLVKSQ